jgi:hypothetical protein
LDFIEKVDWNGLLGEPLIKENARDLISLLAGFCVASLQFFIFDVFEDLWRCDGFAGFFIYIVLPEPLLNCQGLVSLSPSTYR